MDYYLVTLSDGSTSFVSQMPDTPGGTALQMQVTPDGVSEVSRMQLNVDQPQFEALATIAHTHDVNFDTLNGSITMTPKQIPKKTNTPNGASA